ncbi:nucleotide exchange factor GrpE [Bacillus sp. FJAT-50079]|uniref:nucleotide exchange factor GrpE n=1 Tax=Bacillus sp. FJAT-50079 TaxID=2833577 RepID=UPI001BCA5AA7|nr:nucleotide exchange factor GrpE [Bacillus sp. FJAT-50079]MBS4209057.1 nucleotide exchange factor GrpE [Bacillus sp. FJAT-50079]
MKDETVVNEQEQEVVEEATVAQNENEEKLQDEETNEEAAVEIVDEKAEKIAELETKLEEAENRYLRLYADFENFRRRTQLDREASEKYRAESLITDLLPHIDNFERAMQMEPEHEQAKALLAGVDMVYRGIIEALDKEGAKQIEAVGNEFDPHLHQAVMQSEDEQYGSNIVVEEFQKGYQLKDRVIRPSMVKVNK